MKPDYRRQRRSLLAVVAVLTLTFVAVGPRVLAFCGFYVAQADAELFNESSKVIIAREDTRTVLSMANDYQGEVENFALVVPVPVVLQEGQVQVGDPTLFERIDAYSAPRLVEYFDEDPCRLPQAEVMRSAPTAADEAAGPPQSSDALGVTVEASFSVGEYDIVVLSAEESSGLETWLVQNDYNIPAGVREPLQSYIAQGMKFFVARVNLDEFESRGYQFLRPLVMAFESESFMLPLQLGMVNANGPQDMIVYLLSPQGRVELANYATVNIPSNVNLPEFVEDEFGEVYQAIFAETHQREGGDAAILEYAWDMSWCDPCAADPLSRDELLRAGVFWLEPDANVRAPNVYLTRLHVRYTEQTFPEDLMFRATDNRQNYQGRYILQRPFRGEITCEEGKRYVEQVQERREQEAQRLANLTGWSITEVRERMGDYNPEVSLPSSPSWWQRVFDSF
ncbi:MAG: DUF2330 domain-containing protein [Trueperaceae bacterium]|nr:DUF2330 domain-containing protein [Trueperaceae bacterium]